MTKPPSRRLKVHIEPTSPEDPLESEQLADAGELAELFAAATGWRVESVESDQDGESDRWRLTPPEGAFEQTPVAAPAVRRLAEQVTSYHRRLEEAYQALREREAELATAIPLSVLDDEGVHLAERLEWVLQAGAEALGCDAAALYLLDDATQELKLRVAWGLPRHRLAEPPRALRGAVADLEALMGSAVVLEDVEWVPLWRAPERFPSALCVPVSTSHTPLGTLWFFSRQRRGFDDAQVQLSEVISGRIVADLERETLRHEVRRNRDYARQMRDALLWQQERLPEDHLPLDDWSLAGYRNPAGWVGGGFYDWIVLPDSRILLLAASMSGEGVVASLGSAFLRGALWSHAQMARDPSDLLAMVHETLWTASPGGQRASVFAAIIEPETAKWDYAASGEWYLWFGGKQAQFEFVHGEWLGDQLDATWPKRVGPKWRRGMRLAVATADSFGEDDWLQVTEGLRKARVRSGTAATTLGMIRDCWSPANEPPSGDQVLVIAQRHSRR